MTRTPRSVLPVKLPEPCKVRLAELNFAPYNPRIMPPAEMRKLKASLRKHGLVLNLVVQKQGMVLIGGHQRVDALRSICADDGVAAPEEVWATVLDVSDNEAKQLNVSLNKISGEFDSFRLGELLSSLASTMTPEDVLASGFSAEEVAELVGQASPPELVANELEQQAGDLTAFARSVTLTVEFNTVEQRDAVKEVLAAAVKQRGVKAGVVVQEALAKLPAPKQATGKRGAKQPAASLRDQARAHSSQRSRALAAPVLRGPPPPAATGGAGGGVGLDAPEGNAGGVGLLCHPLCAWGVPRWLRARLRVGGARSGPAEARRPREAGGARCP